MNINLGHAIGNIIGQTPSQTLAAFRAPHFLPNALLEHRPILWLILMIAGLIALYMARQRRERRVQLVAAALLMATLCWFLLAQLFVSSAQRLEAVHHRILAAAQAKDIPAVMNNLAATFHWGPLTKDAMPTMVQASLDSITVKAFYVAKYESDIETDEAQTRIAVTVYTDAGQFPTQWQLHWHDEANADWQLVAVEQSKVGDQNMPTGLVH